MLDILPNQMNLLHDIFNNWKMFNDNQIIWPGIKVNSIFLIKIRNIIFLSTCLGAIELRDRPKTNGFNPFPCRRFYFRFYAGVRSGPLGSVR